MGAEAPPLVGQAEAAEVLGVTPARVWQLDKQTARFPEPVVRLAAGPVWALDDVRAFLSAPRGTKQPVSQHPPLDLFGASEAAALLDVTTSQLGRLASREGFPEPVARLKLGSLWWREDVLHFLLHWRRKPGRRPANRTP